ncbi:MAG: glycoside hydrolase family 13 protein [Clostridia bacterium]|nr:glycoside hydrolase family 13 protein [Clostridia bacterium]
MLKGFGTSKKYNPLLFCSRELCFKKPFGAVATDEEIEITFPVSVDYAAEKVDIVLRQGECLTKFTLDKLEPREGYDIFHLSFRLKKSATYFYRFEITRNKAIAFVGKAEGGLAKIQDWLPEWQLSVYDESYRVPDINAGGVIYHIFVDRFATDGEILPPRYGVLKEWSEDVTIMDSDGAYRANDFFGGNFKGIIKKLGYFKELGVTLIYLSPIFESSSNHRYDTGDYSKIDAMLGGEEGFTELLEVARNNGIGVILDGVFNHTGADSLYFNKFGHYDSVGAYQSKHSPYFDWYTFQKFPDLYECWWGITVVPTVSRKACGYQEMIAGQDGLLRKWTKAGVAGWRLDVVDELSTPFIEKIHAAIKDECSDALVIGEVWEDASTKYSYGEERGYFRGGQLDGVMNYPFKKAVHDYVLFPDASLFIERVTSICENYPTMSLNTCMTLLGSHDTVRVINSLSKANVKDTTKEQRKAYRLSRAEYDKGKKRLLLASCLQYFLPGLPTIYYGDETGMQGFEDPLNRRTFVEEKADTAILTHYRRLGKLRSENREAFKSLFDGITCDGEVVFIKRQRFTLITNPTKAPYALSGVFSDYLSGSAVGCVEGQSAVILIDFC